MNKFEVNVGRKVLLGLIKEKLETVEGMHPDIQLKSEKEVNDQIEDDRLTVNYAPHGEYWLKRIEDAQLSIERNLRLLPILAHYNKMLNIYRMVEICKDDVFTLSEYLSNIIHTKIKEL